MPTDWFKVVRETIARNEEHDPNFYAPPPDLPIIETTPRRVVRTAIELVGFRHQRKVNDALARAYVDSINKMLRGR